MDGSVSDTVYKENEDGENRNEGPAAPLETEVLDINEAMRRLREKDKGAPAPTMEAGGGEPTSAGGTGEGTSDATGAADAGVSEGTVQGRGPQQQDVATGAGGPATQPQVRDWGTAREAYWDNVRREAETLAAEQLEKEGVGYFQMDNMVQRSDNGEITFINPDTGKPFSSGNPRYEAQVWIDSFNKQVDGYYNQVVNGMAQQIAEEEEAARGILEFGPVWDGLDPSRKKLLDTIIKPYEVHNDQGALVGYSCDLDVALQQVDGLMALQGTGQAKQEEARTPATVKKPAVDMKTSGGSNETVKQDNAPKDINEAMKMYNATQKAKKGKK